MRSYKTTEDVFEEVDFQGSKSIGSCCVLVLGRREYAARYSNKQDFLSMAEELLRDQHFVSNKKLVSVSVAAPYPGLRFFGFVFTGFESLLNKGRKISQWDTVALLRSRIDRRRRRTQTEPCLYPRENEGSFSV